MIAGVPAESFPGERRVALVPDVAHTLVGKGVQVVVEAGAGTAAGYPDEAFRERGAGIAADRAEVFAQADVVLQVRTYGANPDGQADLARLREGQAVIGFAEPLEAGDRLRETAATGALLFALEFMPRVARAQSMDALSSMATISGYKAVLMAASELPRIFPLLMTAAGTLAPARVLVIGAGVAGLQAIASARRLGARVQAYDVRPAVKEQVKSLGADFIELDLASADAEDAGGYARAQDEAFYERQRLELGKVVADADVVIATAAIPGQRAPILISADAVRSMRPGAVVVDLAAERGGNCELTRPGETVTAGGARVLGPLNLSSSVPGHASQMFAHNTATFLLHLLGTDGAIAVSLDDEITASTLVTRGGRIVHPRLAGAQG